MTKQFSVADALAQVQQDGIRSHRTSPFDHPRIIAWLEELTKIHKPGFAWTSRLLLERIVLPGCEKEGIPVPNGDARTLRDFMVKRMPVEWRKLSGQTI